MTTTEMPGIALVEGKAEGPFAVLKEPLSFWGGFDAESGRVIDRHHPDYGLRLTGCIVVMRAARGSSSGSSVLAEAIRANSAPAGFVLATRDPILTVGAQVALELYGRACPLVLVNQNELAQVPHARSGQIETSDGHAVIRF